jgi:sulfite reductase alpha subunit-like flavoprotein
MLTNDKKQILDQIISNFSKEEIAWSSGYLSGFIADEAPSKAVKAIPNLTILYVTETGNAKFLATEINKKLKAAKINAKMKDVQQYRLNDFAKEQNLILITSTHGDGEIPDSGKKFEAHLNDNDLDLSKLKFITVALGDRNYPLFCESGKIFENRLIELKATKIADRIDLDLDFENSIPQIFETITASFTGEKVETVAKSTSTQTNFSGTVLTNVNLNDIGSDKETYHMEISVDDGEIDYAPGDSIGILLGNEELKVEGAITPRLYSIASSKNEHGNEVHLTVSLLKYKDDKGNDIRGLFSGHLAKLKEGDNVKFYVSRNRAFKLPEDNKDIIMVGPGTGVAPFRSFIAERNYSGAEGKNWLFFGERTFQNDFLYQSEWQDHLSSGVLTKLDLAFSRDQKEKIYVQDRIRQNAEELYKWLESGAYFYVCGDKENMAKDVEKSLLELIAAQGKKSPEDAQEYLNNLSGEGRYLKDVY